MTAPTAGGRRLKIGLFYLHPPEQMPSYVRRDMRTLSEIGDVRWMNSQEGRGWRRVQGPTGWWPSPRMIRFVRSCDVVVQWFVTPSAPMVAARLCGKPSLAISAGFDVACLPEIGYGCMAHPRKRKMGQIALKLARKIVPISAFNCSEVLRWVPAVQPEVVHLGFEPELYPLGVPAAQRKRQVVTVGALRDDYIQRKGLDTFARTSRLLPEVPFIVAGKHINESAVRLMRELGGPNLQLTDFLPDDALNDLLQNSAVYAQLSLHEAFGCSVAESMLAGCMPVISTEGALAEVVGPVGHIVPPKDPEAAARAIALALDDLHPEAARRRIAETFPAHKRAAELQRQVLALVN